MTTPQRRVGEIFEAALPLPPQERAAYLAEACGTDAHLRAEVESLLRHDEAAPSEFMRAPEGCIAAGGDRFGNAGHRVGTRIGGFEIKGVIASGGMGMVYEAVQEEPRRLVALKLMHRGISSRATLQRFRHEAEILARLQHPNISQVFAAGMHEEGGIESPYFVMEYITGARTLIEYAEAKRLSIRERAELFVHVCDGVQHGHQKGIVHRDLKPGNILVDAEGRVRIIDFGVARSTDADMAVTTLRTSAGQIIGTLQYMSPEQSGADPQNLDTRTDVYSLGVVLYELLTGLLPYDVSSLTIHAAVRQICEEEPKKPAEHDRRLRGDLETITLKALEKDREKRYQSAAELAQDLRHYLEGEPICARPPTTWMRMIRWASRRPLGMTAAACLTMIGLAVASSWITSWYAGRRPCRVDVSADRSFASLMSFSGLELKRWKGSLVSASQQLVDFHDANGTKRLAIIGFNRGPDGAFRDSLCAYDVAGDLNEPLWHHEVLDTDILPELKKRGFVGADYHLSACAVFDIFPDRPGNEIVAMFEHHAYAHPIIRIYGLDGELLYQIWNQGSLGFDPLGFRCYWMDKAGLLVFTGIDDEHPWRERGFEGLPNPYPQVIFALRPRIGLVLRDYVRRESAGLAESVAWHKCLLPPEAYGNLDVSIPPPRYDAGQNVQCHVRLKNLKDGISWVLTAEGKTLPGSLIVGDNYSWELKDPQTTVLSPDVLSLGNLPTVERQSD